MKTNINRIRIGHNIQKGDTEFLDENSVEIPIFDQKIEQATEGLEPYYRDHLKTKISKKNSIIIARYILSMRIDTNLSDNHRRGVITSLKILSVFLLRR